MPDQQEMSWERFKDFEGPTYTEELAARKKFQRARIRSIHDVLRDEPNGGIQHGISKHRGSGRGYR